MSSGRRQPTPRRREGAGQERTRTCHTWPLGPRGQHGGRKAHCARTCWKGPCPARLCVGREQPGLFQGEVIACQTRVRRSSLPPPAASQWKARGGGDRLHSVTSLERPDGLPQGAAPLPSHPEGEQGKAREKQTRSERALTQMPPSLRLTHREDAAPADLGAVPRPLSCLHVSHVKGLDYNLPATLERNVQEWNVRE